MKKSLPIERIYCIALGVFCAAVGIAVICVAADIYYSGAETGVYYTREIAADRLIKLAIPCVLLVAAIIIGAVIPLAKQRVKPEAELGVKRLSSRMPADGSGEEYEAAKAVFEKTRKLRLAAWLAASAVTAACVGVLLWYLLDTAHFSLDTTASMLDLVAVAMPVTAISLAALVAASVANGVFAKKQLAALKTLIKCGNGEPRGKAENKILAALGFVASSDITLWVVRGAVLVVAVVFVVLGVLNGGANDVLVKATNICTECIGLG